MPKEMTNLSIKDLENMTEEMILKIKQISQ